MKNEPKRTCAAIMFSDIVGYTALMGEDQELAFQLVKKNSRFHQEVIKIHHGKLIKELGDGVLCYFHKPEDAVAAAYELQQHYFKNKELSLRIGIHFGEVILDRNDVFGDAVNIASRLQTLGSPGSVLFSQKIREDIDKNSSLKSVSLGKFKLKNVKEPLEVFALANNGLVIPKRGEMLKLLESRLKKFMVGGLVVMTLALVAFGIYHQKSINKLMAQPEKSIAVLPFENLDQLDDYELLTDGLTQDIISQLSKISSMRVISNSSSGSFKNSDESSQDISASLNVTYLLEGNIQVFENKIKIRTYLIEGAKNKTIWSETYEMEMEDLFQVQSQIAQSIAHKMSAALTSLEKKQLDKKPTGNISAYQIFLKGRDYYTQYDSSANQKAILEFKKALQMDPNFALAMTGLADAFSQNAGRFNMDKKIWTDSSIYISNLALKIDSTLSEAYRSIGIAYYYRDDFKKSINFFNKALEINPNNAQAIGNLGSCLLVTGQLDEAIKYQKISASLNPKSFIPFMLVGWNYRMLGDYDNAILWLEKSLGIMPYRDTYEHLAYTYIAMNEPLKAKGLIPIILSLQGNESEKYFETSGIISFFIGDFENSLKYLRKAVDLSPQIGTDIEALSPIYLAYLEKKQGNIFEADLWLDRSIFIKQVEVDKETQYPEFYLHLAMLHAIKGEKEKSINFLNQAKNKNWIDVFMVKLNPIFEDFRDDPNFKKIIDEVTRNIALMKDKTVLRM
jgi:TolB-like protein/class 3 adenylate cyclase